MRVLTGIGGGTVCPDCRGTQDDSASTDELVEVAEDLSYSDTAIVARAGTR